ncbi:MAG: Asp-tRNA(Asn)/Glu-tRNA(Gln) amidotransferase subunit GatC [Alphaproteobacteria bacterium]|nr:Asp-tRNA(Asn)/Glu-tRNA(Gln) amidotransferase subunit GatC [Alphaproteobacteria bacterium]
MSIDKNTVEKVARLARIRLEDDKAEQLAGDLNKILGMIAELNEVDTAGVEPMTGVIDMKLPEREDKITDGNNVDAVLLNAPEQTAGFFVVPKVVE